MKLLISIIFLTFLGLQNTSTNKLSIEFENFKQEYIGKEIYIGYWLSNNSKFPKKNATDFAQIIKAKSKSPRISKQLESRIYAVSIFIDLNGNGKMDTNIFGYPKEPYCFSNNFKPRFSAPDFEDCSFSLEANLTLKLRLID